MTELEAKACQKYIRVSPKKLRRLAKPLQKKSLPEGRASLRFSPSYSSIPLIRAINSAAQNLKKKKEPDGLEDSNIYIERIQIDQGPSYKRLLPRARGTADIIKHRTSHITVIVKEK